MGVELTESKFNKDKTTSDVQKAFVVSMTGKGYAHEQAMEMFGCVAEYVCDNYVSAYNKGFDAGCAETKRKVEKGKVVKRDPSKEPDMEGILPLTDEEKHEFSKEFVKHTNFIYYIRLVGSRIHIQFLDGRYDDYCDNCLAIMWLAERFNLVTAK